MWRYGFVSYRADGSRDYSSMYSAKSGQARYTVPSGVQKLYFVVMGAPENYRPHPWDEQELNDEQWPYKVKFGNTDLLQ